jgi:hypothetical protein
LLHRSRVPQRPVLRSQLQPLVVLNNH